MSEFDKWWASGIHGWGNEQLAEYKLAKDAWAAARARILEILNNNQRTYSEEYNDWTYIDCSVIEEIEEL